MKQKVKEILRESVHQHEYPVNPEEIFVGALARIKKEKKDKKIYLLGFLLFLGVSVFLKFQLSTLDTNNNYHSGLSDTSIGATENVSESMNKNNLPEDVYVPQASSLGSIAEAKNDEAAKIAPPAQKNITSQDIVKEPTQKKATRRQGSNTTEQRLNSQPTKKNSPKSTTKPVKNRSTLKTESNVAIKGKEVVKGDIVSSTKAIKSLLPIVTAEGDLGKTNEDLRKADENISNVVNNVITPIQAASKKETPLKEKTATRVVSQESTQKEALGIKDLMNISMVDILMPSSFEIEERVLGLKNSLAENIVEVESTVVKPKFALSLVGSYGIFQKEYIANDEKYLAYLNARNDAEIELEVLSTKLMMSYDLTDLFQVSTGLKVQQINEEFSWDGSYVVNELGEKIEVDPNADNLVGIPYFQEVDRDLVNYTQHQLVSIPVLFGIRKNINVFTIGLNAGPLFNVYTKTTGLSLSEDLIPVALDDTMPEFKLGLETNLELGYSLGKKTDFIVDFSFQRMNAQEQFLNSTFNSFSVGVGLKKRF